MEKLEGDNGALFNAAMVHPTWAKYAVSVLWRYVRLGTAFAAVNGERRQVYAAYVRRLCVSLLDDHSAAANPPLQFPRLREIEINDEAVKGPRNAGVPPSSGGVGDNRQQQRQLDNVGSLLVNLAAWVTPSVKTFTLVCGDDAALAQITCWLLPRDHLTTLRLELADTPLPPATLGSLADAQAAGAPSCFSNLQSFRLEATAAAVAALATALQPAPLVRLELAISGPAHAGRVLATVSRLAALQGLRLVFWGSVLLRRAELRPLRALTGLRALRIQRHDDSLASPISAPRFTGADFAQLLRGLPRLRRLVFAMEAGWAVRDDELLQQVAHAAPRLEQLRLWDLFPLQKLDPHATTPLFPQLTELELTGITLVMPPGVSQDEEEDALSLE